MLSAGSGTCIITANDGSAFTIDSADFDEVIVQAGADIGTLTIQGDSSSIRVEIEDDARTNGISFQGGRGDETLILRGEAGAVTFNGRGGDDAFFMFGGAVTSAITWNGDAGEDRLSIAGFNGGTTTVQGGAGIDRVAIAAGADLRGDLSGSLGEGNDRVVLKSEGTANQTVTKNIDLDLGAGNNVFDFFRPTQINGNFKLTGGDNTDVVRFRGGEGIDDVLGNLTILTNGGNDQVTFAGAMDVDGNQTLNTGANSDQVVFTNFTLQGNQTIELGTSANGRDSLRFGADDINGSSKTTANGNAFIQESAARNVQSDYTVQVNNGADLAVALSGESIVQGNISITASGDTTIGVNSRLTMGNVTISTGAGVDNIRLAGLMIENTNNLNVSTGGGDDEVDLDGATVTGNSNVSVGEGDDTVFNEEFEVDGTPTFVGGSGFDRITDPIQGNVSGFETN